MLSLQLWSFLFLPLQEHFYQVSFQSFYLKCIYVMLLSAGNNTPPSTHLVSAERSPSDSAGVSFCAFWTPEIVLDTSECLWYAPSFCHLKCHQSLPL